MTYSRLSLAGEAAFCVYGLDLHPTFSAQLICYRITQPADKSRTPPLGTTTMRNIVAAAMLAALLPFAGCALTETPTDIAGPTVYITQGSGHGSGVHIGNGYIITAGHVAKDSTALKVKTDNGKTITASVMWVNKAYDIALLRVPDAHIATAPLSCRTAREGEELRAEGSPLTVEFVSAWGRVSGNDRELGPWKHVLITDLTIAPGMSGGPVFDNYGNVVGISVGVLTVPMGFAASLTGFGTVVPSSAVCELMGRAAIEVTK